jgi:TetR/AcrR family transcriptional repressor of nem operon
VAEGHLRSTATLTVSRKASTNSGWGASVMVKIVRHTKPFEAAMATTLQILHLPP